MITAAGRAASRVEIHKRRVSGDVRPLWWHGRVVDDDAEAEGTWILVDARTPFWFEHGWALYVVPSTYLIFRPHDDQDWVAAFGYTNNKLDLTSRHVVDLEAGRFELWDVELDLVWRWGHPARVVDQEEFAALGLPADEVRRLEAVAERQRRRIDTGVLPFGAATRDRLFDLAGPPAHESHTTAWMGGLNAHLVEESRKCFDADRVASWVDRQRACEGWILAGGQGPPSVFAWLSADLGEDPSLVLVDDDPDVQPLAELALQTAVELHGCPHPPPLGPYGDLTGPNEKHTAHEPRRE